MFHWGMWIVFGLPAVGAGLLLLRGLYLAAFPPDRKLIAKAIEFAHQTTGRPIKDIHSGEIRGFDGKRTYIRIFFDDNAKFGSPVGPPRKYYAVDIESGEVTESSVQESRPFRWGPPDPADHEVPSTTE
ncbi:hypothetical protein LOC68_18155 [Blastopirellula sp. JC732]|uniref:Uncharacterized protein n=1 Tax=Blastopirellula sediminis TaxID=2894196 RepID=A0A9X1MQR8_9BACT|nr:hypothetical protein [Blastopirellula sediminis]MCC9606380.1 hypothetical protein [Blastopirellula sediminis]MCC9630322.1 hypothetical protein [Blastopirellula sediminis]